MTQSIADEIAPILRRESDLRECERLWRRYYEGTAARVQRKEQDAKERA